jgi:hypothetical protein
VYCRTLVAPIIITCPSCGGSFPSAVDATASSVVLTNYRHPCPFCGASVTVTGYYDDTSGFIGRMLAVRPTPQEIRAFVAALQTESAKEGPRRAAAVVAQAAPRLEPLLTDYFGWSQEKWLSFLGALLAVIGGLIGILDDGKLAKAFQALGLATTAAAVASDGPTKRRSRNKRKRERRTRQGK